MSYQAYLDQLIAFASSEERKPDLLAAKAEYFQRTGEVFEDDKQFEMRMASFLDHYLFDRPRPESGKTPAQEFLEARSAAVDPGEIAAFRSFTETVHGLFEVRKVKPGIVRLRELFGGKEVRFAFLGARVRDELVQVGLIGQRMHPERGPRP